MNKTMFSSAIVIAVLAAALPISAHHSWPVDMSKLVTVKGTVTEVMWENPHPMFTLEVRTSDAKTEKWTVGGPAITGWRRTAGLQRRSSPAI